jgi:phosphopantothenoylcysteine decarboxylase/phosphopantothenate--cysteine ligase
MANIVYYMISGAATAYRASEIIAGLNQTFDSVFTLQTPNALRLISPRDLVRIPNNHVIESYFDTRILPRPARGTVLFAPCNFNSLNKLAHGIADNLALSIAAEMIGFRERVVIALSLNEPLYAHPIVRTSIDTLRSWGAVIIEPQDIGEGLTMSPTATLLDAVRG